MGHAVPSPSPPLSARVLIIDEDPVVRERLDTCLRNIGYLPRTARDGQEGLEQVKADPPDIILSGLQLTGLDGMEVVRRLKADAGTRLIPIVLLTGTGDAETKARALDMGVDGFLSTPTQAVELAAHLRTLLRLKLFTDSLEGAEAAICALAESIETRDTFTGRHCTRLAAYAGMLGRALGASEEEFRTLRCGAILHDLGKVAVPDAILRKQQPLTDAEWTEMKKHPVIGERICRSMGSMRAACPIIRHHHERWDGKGYPDGLAGEAIPWLARVVQLVDAYDALRALRPYKSPMTKQQVFWVLRREASEGKWDPRILDRFLWMMAADVPLEETYLQDYLAAQA